MDIQTRKKLRSQAHKLKPVVLVGQAGLSEAVLSEIHSALAHHELLKIRIRTQDRGLRAQIIEKISAETESELIQTIGQTAVIYRQNPDKSTTTAWIH